MTVEIISIGQLNSKQGKAYAQTLRADALVDIAAWCEQARDGLDCGTMAEQADAALYYDLECLLRKVAEHAA